MQHTKSHYPLKEVKALVASDNWRPNKNAREGARKCFGWGVDEIRAAIMALKPCHFYKSDWSECKPGIMLDFYKIEHFKGEKVYTHFYIDNDNVFLIINSFKKTQG